MLILSAKPNERIHLFDGSTEIGEVMVTDVRGKQVQLGFNFSKKYTILREQVINQVKVEK